MNTKNPIIVITGSCVNSDISYLPNHLGIEFDKNTTILSSNTI